MQNIIKKLLYYERSLSDFYTGLQESLNNKVLIILEKKQKYIIADLERIINKLENDLTGYNTQKIRHYFDSILVSPPEDPHRDIRMLFDLFWEIEKSLNLYYYELKELLKNPDILSSIIAQRSITLKLIYNYRKFIIK